MGKKGKEDSTTIIKNIVDEKKINTRDIETLAGIDYPLFSFRWLQNYSFDKCEDSKFFRHFLLRLQKMSELGWKSIRVSGRHQFGMEKIPRDRICLNAFPSIVTPDVTKFDVFRAVGDNRPMVGLCQGKIFHVIFIEAAFGDVYRHNR